MAEAKNVGHIFLSNKSLLASQLLLNLQTSTNQDKTDSLKLFVCIVHSYVDSGHGVRVFMEAVQCASA